MPLSIRETWLLIALLVSACSGPADPWSTPVQLPVSDDTVRITHTEDELQVPRLAIRFDRDLVIGDSELPAFGSARRLAVDDDGNIYLPDRTEANIKVFDSSGRLVRVLGRQGQGPGEFSRFLSDVAIAGEHVVVSDMGQRKLSIWTRTGEHLRDDQAAFGASVEGTPAGLRELVAFENSVVGYYRNNDPEKLEFRRFVVVRYDVDEGRTVELLNVPNRQAYADVNGRRISILFVSPSLFLAGASDRFYITLTESYEVAAFDSSGQSPWVVEASWPRDTAPDGEYERAMGVLAAMPGAGGVRVSRRDVRAVDPLPALLSIRADGNGRLYVFPFVYYVLGRRETVPEMLQVQVFDDAGGFIGVAEVPSQFGLHPDQSGSWLASNGDYIYGIEEGPGDDQVIVRYRITITPS